MVKLDPLRIWGHEAVRHFSIWTSRLAIYPPELYSCLCQVFETEFRPSCWKIELTENITATIFVLHLVEDFWSVLWGLSVSQILGRVLPEAERVCVRSLLYIRVS